MPTAVIVHYSDGVYSTDSDEKIDEESTLLTQLGTMLEHFLVQSRESFASLQKSSGAPPQVPERQSYQYTLTGDLLMRSQLDCWDPRLPGTGYFDIKTRAVVAIRRDLKNYQENSGYVIRKLSGLFESYEREHYDLLRSGLLKYFFQARIGNMDGIFIAFHNTSQLLGFQYVPLIDMDAGLFGNSGVGDRIFRMCIGLLGKVMGVIQECSPQQSCSVILDNAADHSGLRVWIEPLNRPPGDASSGVTELLITVRHYHNGKRSFYPIFAEKDWTLEYLIRKVPPSAATRARRDEALRRRDAIGHPPLDHSSPSKGDKSLPLKSIRRRRRHNSFIAHLRRLSRDGRRYTEERAKSQGEIKMWNSASSA